MPTQASHRTTSLLANARHVMAGPRAAAASIVAQEAAAWVAERAIVLRPRRALSERVRYPAAACDGHSKAAADGHGAAAWVAERAIVLRPRRALSERVRYPAAACDGHGQAATEGHGAAAWVAERAIVLRPRRALSERVRYPAAACDGHGQAAAESHGAAAWVAERAIVLRPRRALSERVRYPAAACDGHGQAAAVDRGARRNSSLYQRPSFSTQAGWPSSSSGSSGSSTVTPRRALRELQAGRAAEQRRRLHVRGRHALQREAPPGPARQDRVDVLALGREERLDRGLARRRLLGQLRDVVDRLVLLVVLDLRLLARAPLLGDAERPRAVDRLAVDLQPGAHLRQPLLHHHRDRAVGVGADVEQEVAAAADDVAQDHHQLAPAVVVLQALGAVVAVGEAHAAALLPRVGVAAHAGRVLGGPVAAVLVARVLAPAVVDHHLVLHLRLVEQPGQQLRALPVGRGQVPLAVGEDEGRLVAA